MVSAGEQPMGTVACKVIREGEVHVQQGRATSEPHLRAPRPEAIGGEGDDPAANRGRNRRSGG